MLIRGRVVHAEYVVRISVPRSSPRTLAKYRSQFTESVYHSMRAGILAGTRNATGEYIKAGKLDKAFDASVE